VRKILFWLHSLNAGDHAKSFIDTGIEWEKAYEYWIVPVTLWQEGARKGEIEGEDSPVANVLAHDSFLQRLRRAFRLSSAPQLRIPLLTLRGQPTLNLTWPATTFIVAAENEPQVEDQFRAGQNTALP